MDRLVLIDAHAIIHRAYHALPPLTNSKGEQTGAVYGFASILLRVIQNLKPTHLAVAFDRPKPTFRKKLFKDYQAQRPKLEEELVPQIGKVHQLVEAFGIPIFEMDGYEADDVIGTIAKHITYNPSNTLRAGIKHKTKNNIEVVIVTGDRDILQLVNEHVRVFMPVKGLAEGKLYGEKEVEEKFGIKASQVVDYKALVGDQSDNYPGVSGIGPKTASLLLNQFQTLERMYKHLDEIKNEKVRQKLEVSREAAELSKTLATIVTKVPVEIDFSRCKLPELDRPDVHHVFEELGFISLIPRLSLDKTYNIEHITKNKKQNITNSQQTSLF